MEILIILGFILLTCIFIDETFEAEVIDRLNFKCHKGHYRENPDMETPCPTCINQEIWKYRTSPEALEKWKKSKWKDE